MKKLEQYLETRICAVVLHKEDLQGICNVFANIGNIVHLNDDVCEYESLVEFYESKKDRIKKLEISNLSSLHFSFDEKYGVELSVRTGNKDCELAFYQISQILKSRFNWWSLFANPQIFLWVSLGLLVFTPTIPFLSQNKISVHSFLLLIAVAILFGGLMGSLGMCFFNSIKLISKTDEQSFWKRNKDKILLALISALISGIVGFFLGKFK